MYKRNRILTIYLFLTPWLAQSSYANQDVLINFHARIQLDAHDFTFPRLSDDFRSTSLSELRQARLESVGVFYDTFKYKLSAEVSDEVEVKDAFIGIQGDALRFEVGQFYYPFGNESQGESKYTEFMEKASITSLVSYGRDRGFSLQTFHSRYLFLQAGIVRGSGANTRDNDNGYDKVIRFGVDTNPRGKSDNRYLFGFSAAAGRQKSRQDDIIQIDSESHSGMVLFKAGLAENTQYLRSRFALESTILHGSFMLKPEFFYDHYGFDESVHILGFYTAVSYFLTGEQRSLNNGLLTRQRVYHPISHGGWGAWEVALRYSSYTVNSAFYRDNTLYLGWKGLSKQDNPQKAHALTFGLNWYPHGLIRLMANTIYTYTQHPQDNGYELREIAWMFRMQAEY